MRGLARLVPSLEVEIVSSRSTRVTARVMLADTPDRPSFHEVTAEFVCVLLEKQVEWVYAMVSRDRIDPIAKRAAREKRVPLALVRMYRMLGLVKGGEEEEKDERRWVVLESGVQGDVSVFIEL